jgi:L-seryl-tRNA(Ser) seleniumtransferase
MIRAGAAEIESRARNFLTRAPSLAAEVIAGDSVIGGGATPEQRLPTSLIAIRSSNVIETERRLRRADPPVIARIEGDRLLIDLRTVLPAEENELAIALSKAAG